MTQAKRIASFDDLESTTISYWKEQGVWYLYLPGCGLGNLSNHTVVEHEDGTISVTPSIRVQGHESGIVTEKHGHLTHGEWKDC